MVFADAFLLLGLRNGCAVPVELVPGKGNKDVLDIVMLLLGQRGTALDDDLVPTHTVVQLVMDQLVDMGVEVELVLFVVVLRTDAD